MMNTKYLLTTSVALLLGMVLASSCTMEELPRAKASKAAIFGSTNGLELYTNSFYDLLPGNDTGVFTIDETSDLVAVSSISNYLMPGSLTPTTTSGWSWSGLRNINYFIENTEKSDVPGKEHYLGIARFFRAYFYLDKVQRYGDVPIVTNTIEVADSATLFDNRDDRFEVMDFVLKDLDYAIENIADKNEPTRTKITKDVALAYKTRVCLYEASFRKYHTEYGKQSTAGRWYEEVVKAANQLTGYSLYTGEQAYRDLFLKTAPEASEVILAVRMDEGLQIYNSRNRRTISPTFGNRPSINRALINMYLNADGTRFTDDPGYRETPFTEEIRDRDPRLSQTIRMPEYTRTRNGVAEAAPPNFSESFTGYQIIKGMYDEIIPYDDESRNLNAHIILRYAEVLLNKAEALAELGRMTNAEWTATIGAIRARAGITGSTLTQIPTAADPYLLEYYRGRFTDPVLLEVIRERAVEMILEGLRPEDLRRWKLGELFAETPMSGVYVPSLGEYDLDGDGTPDVLFYQGDAPASSAPTKIEVSSQEVGKRYLSNGTSGELIWNPGPREWADKKYLYPIPHQDLIDNPNLKQNPGW